MRNEDGRRSTQGSDKGPISIEDSQSSSVMVRDTERFA